MADIVVNNDDSDAGLEPCCLECGKDVEEKEAPGAVLFEEDGAAMMDPALKQRKMSHLGFMATSTSNSAGWTRPSSPHLRLGVLLYLLGTLALLLASDIGRGFQALTVVVPAPHDIWSKPRETLVSDESIFSSVGQLWDAGSYPLAIFVVATSIAWPYIKLLLTIFAWVAPFQFPQRSRRREQLIIFLGVLSKWSFADMLVFCQLLVAFSATVPVGFGTTMEVYLLVLWGFYGFVAVTILGLVGTHFILWYHRRCVYSHQQPTAAKDNDHTHLGQSDMENLPAIKNPEQHELQQQVTSQTETSSHEPSSTPMAVSKSKQSQHWTGIGTRKRYGFTVLSIAAIFVYLLGCSLPIFEVSRQRGDVETTYVEYSIVSIGAKYFDLSKDGTLGDRWVQLMWFFLTLFMPLLSTLLMCCLLLVPMKSRKGQEKLYLWSEIAFCWSCAEVTVVSTLFASTQIPKIGNGMVESGCDTCYVIGTTLYAPAIFTLTIGALLSVLTSCWVLRSVHQTLYPHGLRQ